MNIAGLCEICGKEASPSFGCMMCGAITCYKCFDHGKNLCIICAGGRGKIV